MAEAIFILPNDLPDAFKNEVYQGATLFLEIGKRMIDSANLSPNLFVEGDRNALTLPNEITDYSLSMDELKQLCKDKFISHDVFLNFVCDPADPHLEMEDPDLNPVLYKPLVLLDEKVCFS